MQIRSVVASRKPLPMRAAAAPQPAKTQPTPVQPAQPVKAASGHAIAKWSIIGGAGLGALGIPMMAMLGGAGLGLWMAPAALAGAALGAVCYGGVGTLVDLLVHHFKK